MTPAEKSLAVEIFEKHDERYTAECLKEFNSRLSIAFTDMQNLRVCLHVAKEHPEHLTREPGGKVDLPEEPAEVT